MMNSSNQTCLASFRKTLLRAVALAAVLCVSSCSRSGPTCFPVQGTVLLDGKPLEEAMIILHPLGAQPQTKQKPIGYSDQSGHFELTTWRSGDGAPPGDYAITVELRAMRKVGEEMIRDGRNVLPPRFAVSKTTPLRCTINETANELPPLRLPSR